MTNDERTREAKVTEATTPQQASEMAHRRWGIEHSPWTERMLARLAQSESTTKWFPTAGLRSRDGYVWRRFLLQWLVSQRPHRLESRMREIRTSGSEGGVALITPSLPLSIMGPIRQRVQSFPLAYSPAADNR